MPSGGDDRAPLTAVCLPPSEAAVAIRNLWDARRAVLPLDPRAPAGDLGRVLAALRPTHVLDTGGTCSLDDGVPVTADVAAVVATSGTTGAPRGVELTWDGLRTSVDATALSVGSRAGDRWLCCIPVHHVAGLAIIARSWLSGIEPIVVPFAAAMVGNVDAAFVSIVPTMLVRALEAGADLRRFRRVLVGAAPLTGAARARAKEAGVPFVDAYGLTETWGGVVHEGRPLTGVQIDIGPHDEILVRGPMVMRGYRLKPEETADAFTSGGWLRTGDAGRVDSDGLLRIGDRLREVIVTGGVNVSPTEVEAVLAACPGVADVCVTGRADPEWGERVVAHIVPEDPARPPDVTAIGAFAAERLAAPKVPKQIVLVATIPRSGAGKLLRRLL
jgi:O-succinylbenzoic acid--CoA ligase